MLHLETYTFFRAYLVPIFKALDLDNNSKLYQESVVCISTVLTSICSNKLRPALPQLSDQVNFHETRDQKLLVQTSWPQVYPQPIQCGENLFQLAFKLSLLCFTRQSSNPKRYAYIFGPEPFIKQTIKLCISKVKCDSRFFLTPLYGRLAQLLLCDDNYTKQTRTAKISHRKNIPGQLY